MCFNPKRRHGLYLRQFSDICWSIILEPMGSFEILNVASKLGVKTHELAEGDIT